MKLLQDKHIFLLEDDPVNFAVIQTILRREGAHPVLDHWGDTSLKKLLNHPFKIDLILLDLMLPRKRSGYEVYDMIQTVPELRDIPVIVVSAADPDVEIPLVKAKGMQGFISKPINHHLFVKQLVSVLNGEAIWDE